jgi:hypothetical protein
MLNSLGIQLVDALHEAWVEVYARQPPRLQWGICKLTMEVNAAQDGNKTGAQLLERALSTLGDAAHPNTSEWVLGVQGVCVPAPIQGSLWDIASVTSNLQPMARRNDQRNLTGVLVLWWAEGALPPPDTYQSGPDQFGRYWTLTRILWLNNRTRGSVLSWNHIQTPSPSLVTTRLREDVKDRILEELYRLGSSHPKKIVEGYETAHRCVDPSCSGVAGLD